MKVQWQVTLRKISSLALTDKSFLLIAATPNQAAILNFSEFGWI
jgi:hypothetical protein